jgi:DivIVA domain-containing protein
MSRPRLLTPKDVRDTTFTTKGFKHDAYKADEVDEFMQDAEHTIRILAHTAHNTWKEQQ